MFHKHILPAIVVSCRLAVSLSSYLDVDGVAGLSIDDCTFVTACTLTTRIVDAHGSALFKENWDLPTLCLLKNRLGLSSGSCLIGFVMSKMDLERQVPRRAWTFFYCEGWAPCWCSIEKLEVELYKTKSNPACVLSEIIKARTACVTQLSCMSHVERKVQLINAGRPALSLGSGFNKLRWMLIFVVVRSWRVSVIGKLALYCNGTLRILSQIISLLELFLRFARLTRMKWAFRLMVTWTEPGLRKLAPEFD